MSAWRRKAIECLPQYRRGLEDKSTTIYEVFFDLLPAVIDAHRRADEAFLRRAYDFAAWCHDQKSRELWNAAGVCFYEHLGDQQETFTSFHRWVRRDIFDDIRPLLAARFSDAQMNLLDRQYRHG